MPESMTEITNAPLLPREWNGVLQFSIVTELYKYQRDQIPNDAIKPLAMSDNLRMRSDAFGSIYDAMVAMNTDMIQSEKSMENRKNALYEFRSRLIDKTANPIKIHSAAAINVNCIIDAFSRLVNIRLAESLLEVWGVLPS